MVKNELLYKIMVPYDIISPEVALLIKDECIKNKIPTDFFFYANKILSKEAIFILNQAMEDKISLKKYNIKDLFDFDNLYNQIHHYEDMRGYVVNSDYVIPEGFDEAGIAAIPITVYNYESELNEKKRRIKVISRKNLNSILNNLRDLIK